MQSEVFEEDELTSGFLKFDEDSDSDFNFEALDMTHYISNDLIAVAASEECLFIATRRNKLIRKRVSFENKFCELSFPYRAMSELVGMYPDLIGNHCIFIMKEGDHCYLSLESDKIVILTKILNLPITSIAYPSTTTSTSTGDILLGCKDGTIYLYRIDITRSNEVQELTLKKVFQVPRGNAIYGLVYETYECLDKTITLIVIFTNETCYQLTGSLPFGNYFIKYDQQKVVIPKGKLKVNEVKFCYQYFGNGLFELRHFVWKTDEGAYYGDFRIKDDVKSSVLIKDLLLEKYKSRSITDQKIPNAVAVTNYNLYFLYSNNLAVVSKISKEIEYSINFKTNEYMNGIIHDPCGKSMWITSEKGINRLIIANEHKNLWRQKLYSGNFEEALRLCTNSNTMYFKHVAGLYGDYKFSEGKFVEAAALYVISNRNFEEIILKYLTVNENEGLRSTV